MVGLENYPGNRATVVTGSPSGIGKAIAFALAAFLCPDEAIDIMLQDIRLDAGVTW